MKGISFLLLLTTLVSCATPEVIDPNPIKAALNTKNDEYRECFLESDSYKGRKSTELQGIIMASFTINALGKAKDGKITESPYKDANLHACILSMIRMIQFPVPKNGEAVEVKEPIAIKARI